MSKSGLLTLLTSCTPWWYGGSEEGLGQEVKVVAGSGGGGGSSRWDGARSARNPGGIANPVWELSARRGYGGMGIAPCRWG